MSRADIKAELEAFIKSGKATSEVNSGNFVTTHVDVLKVAEHFYEKAEKDFMEKVEKWFMEHANIAQEVETDENGEPLADSYIKYAKARIEAAKEMFESFKQAMR